MMRISSLAMAFVAAVLWTHPGQASAQQAPPVGAGNPPPTRPPVTRVPRVRPAEPRLPLDRPTLIDDGSAVVSLYKSTLEFVRCRERSHPRLLAALLEKPVASHAEASAVDRLLRLTSGCPGGRLEVSARMLRGAAAETILENFAVPAPDRATQINSAQVADFATAMPAVDRVRDRNSEDILRFVECQVVLAPGLARNLVSAVPGSNEADNAATQLIAATSRCGVIEARGRPSQIAYRSFLAEAVYHWTRASASGQFS
jgi:hypothetical protein